MPRRITTENHFVKVHAISELCLRCGRSLVYRNQARQACWCGYTDPGELLVRQELVEQFLLQLPTIMRPQTNGGQPSETLVNTFREWVTQQPSVPALDLLAKAWARVVG